MNDVVTNKLFLHPNKQKSSIPRSITLSLAAIATTSYCAAISQKLDVTSLPRQVSFLALGGGHCTQVTT